MKRENQTSELLLALRCQSHGKLVYRGFFLFFLLLFMLLRDMFDMTHVMLSHMQMSFCYQWCSFPKPSCRPALMDFVIKTDLMCSSFICILMKMSL